MSGMCGADAYLPCTWWLWSEPWINNWQQSITIKGLQSSDNDLLIMTWQWPNDNSPCCILSGFVCAYLRCYEMRLIIQRMQFGPSRGRLATSDFRLPTSDLPVTHESGSLAEWWYVCNNLRILRSQVRGQRQFRCQRQSAYNTSGNTKASDAIVL